MTTSKGVRRGKRELRFLSTEQIVSMHEVLLTRWGGHPGGGHRGGSYEGVEAAVQAVKNSYYDAPEELAAALAVYIVQGHVFLDGNKRTGAAAMMVFLELNGIRVNIAPAEIARRLIELQRRSESGIGTAELVQWIARWLKMPAKRHR